MNKTLFKYLYRGKCSKKLFKRSIAHTPNPKILICTLYSGENELEQCFKSVNSQNYKYWDQKVFENLPNKEAHDQLYSFFMKNQKKYDLFIKLDADMVLSDRNVLDNIIEIFKLEVNLDHLQLKISDWYTKSMIWGLHIYSNRAKWVPNKEKLFVDLPPIIPGERINMDLKTQIFAYHSPNPSHLQAFRFGIHRGLKAFQPENVIIDEFRANFQRDILIKVMHNFVASKDRRLGFVLIGAKFVFDHTVDSKFYSSIDNCDLVELFNEYSTMSYEDLYEIINKFYVKVLKTE